jgi:cell division protein FtsW
MKLASIMLVFCVGALLALGLVMLYSARMAEGLEPVGPSLAQADDDGAAADTAAPVKTKTSRRLVTSEQFLTSQLIYCGIGFVFCVAGSLIDPKWLRQIAWPGFVITVLLLVLVLTIGHATHGARRWLFHFQPSEPAKLGLVLAMAHYCASQSKKMGRFFDGFIVPSALLGCVLALIFLEPDWGTTLLLASVGLAMMYMSGTRLLYLIPAIILGASAITFLLWHNPVRMNRMLAFLNPDLYKDGVGYQSWQAMLALGAGGWDGLGLGNGRQKLGFVPENQTDFILSVIGEELGVVATLLVIVLFVGLVTCGFLIAHRSKTTFSYLFGAGISLLIGLQAFINIAVVTSMVPNKGLPLPFISYGGSNLVTMLTAVGFLLGLARQEEDPTSVEEDDPESELSSSDPAASLPF